MIKKVAVVFDHGILETITLDDEDINHAKDFGYKWIKPQQWELMKILEHNSYCTFSSP